MGMTGVDNSYSNEAFKQATDNIQKQFLEQKRQLLIDFIRVRQKYGGATAE